MKQSKKQHDKQPQTATTLRQALTLATHPARPKPREPKRPRPPRRRTPPPLPRHHPKAQLLADPTREITPHLQLAAYEAAVTRRLAAEPIPYITGTQEFYAMASPFHASPPPSSSPAPRPSSSQKPSSNASPKTTTSSSPT